MRHALFQPQPVENKMSRLRQNRRSEQHQIENDSDRAAGKKADRIHVTPSRRVEEIAGYIFVAVVIWKIKIKYWINISWNSWKRRGNSPTRSWSVPRHRVARWHFRIDEVW
jgi:hypothetical protein